MAKVEDERIRTRAHQLWELAGKPQGREDEFWHEAERELSKDSPSKDPAVNPDEASGTFTE